MSDVSDACGACGAALAPGARFCGVCGADVGTAGGTIGTSAIEATAPSAQPAGGAGVAPLPVRAVAAVLDGLVALGVFAVVGAVVANTTDDATENGFNLEGGPALLALGLVTAIVLGYFIVCEAVWGRTLGKLAMGVQVQPAGGRRGRVEAALIRNALRLVDGIGFYLVGGIVALTNPRRQRIGDMAAGTIVTPAPAGLPRALGVAGAIAAMVVGIGGCALLRDPAPAGPPLTGTMARGLTETNRAIEPTTEFRSTDRALYASIKASGVAAGTRLMGRWVFVGPASVAPPDTVIREVSSQFETGNERAGLNLDRGEREWPAGDYRLDLYLDDDLTLTLPFRVRQ